MKKLYSYTILEQSGATRKLPPCPKKTFEELREILGCELIEIIPSDYYKGLGFGRVTMYGDEEARFNMKNLRNVHFQVLKDPEGNEWDVVGTIVCEKVYKGG